MKILNCTNHDLTREQLAMGIIEPKNKQLIRNAITFEEVPDINRIKETVKIIVDETKEENCDGAMLGGAPFLQSFLEEGLLNNNLFPVYAFTKRTIIEEKNNDGSVLKTSLFFCESLVVRRKNDVVVINSSDDSNFN